MEDFNFVRDLPEECLCRICLCLLNDPHLTTCCGHHFCKDCIFKVAQANKSCPMCKMKGFVAVVDKHVQRKIRALTVRCSFYGKGVAGRVSYEGWRNILTLLAVSANLMKAFVQKVVAKKSCFRA